LSQIAEKHIRKGDPLYIEGKLHTRTIRDRDGNMKRVTEIVGTNIIMLSPRHKRENIDDEGFNDDVNLDDLSEDDDISDAGNDVSAEE